MPLDRLSARMPNSSMHRISSLALFLTAVLASCGFDPALGVEGWGLSHSTLRILEGASNSDEAAESLQGALRDTFGSLQEPLLPAQLTGSQWDLRLELRGAAARYRGQCMHCHGAEGGGDGRSAYFLTPSPTDFRLGLFKWTALERNTPPRVEDVEHTLHASVPFTSMPSFSRLKAEELRALAQLVRLLALRGRVESWVVSEWVNAGGDELQAQALPRIMAEALDELGPEWNVAGEAIAVSSPPPPPVEMTAERVRMGRELFFGEAARCSACHGEDLKGAGPAIFQRVPGEDGKLHEQRVPDEWGNPSRPRDLRQGGFRGGSTPMDLYRRIRVGISGTIMPAAPAELSESDLWNLVYFVLHEAGLHVLQEDQR